MFPSLLQRKTLSNVRRDKLRKRDRRGYIHIQTQCYYNYWVIYYVLERLYKNVANKSSIYIARRKTRRSFCIINVNVKNICIFL